MDCPASLSRPILVLDLDETLIFAVAIRPIADHISVRVGRRRMFVLLRPGLSQFLTSISAFFDLYFFTASAKEYANQIIDAISPETPSERRFFREHCFNWCGYPVKDLRALKRPLERMLLVDDMEGSALGQPQNLIRISPWNGNDQTDSVLLDQLLPLLKSVANERNLPAAAFNVAKQKGWKNLSVCRAFEKGFEEEVR
jgi:Dullard-like phosphatase family protein